jgi:hypothetical protein
MKKSILLLLIASILVYGLALAQDNFPPPIAGQQFSPMQPQTPWPGAAARGPGLSGGYGWGGGYGPGMGYGYGWKGGRNYQSMPDNYRGYYKSGPGMMMGQGMTQFGMGPGMIRGVGVMGYIPSETFQKFFDETRKMRKELNGLMFDYAEILRKPKQDPTERIKIESKIMALRQKVYDKAPRYQYPFE